VLNRALRPFLTKWHPALNDYEARKPPDVSSIDHERAWSEAADMRHDLEELQQLLREYAGAIEDAGGRTLADLTAR